MRQSFLSRTISRVLSRMAIYLGLPLPAGSSDLPESRRAALCSLFGLASDGVYICPSCCQEGGSLLHCPSNLTGGGPAVHFCCTVLGVASTGCYPASCPVKPGLSSPVPFRLYSRDHLFYLFFFPIHSRRFLARQQQHCLSDLCCLHIKTASAHKLPAQRIFRQFLTADSQEIFQEF